MHPPVPSTGTVLPDLAQPPAPTPRRTPLALWRALPLTAQLSALGMLVILAWFLVARVAADRLEANERERIRVLEELHAAEVVATRLLASLNGMAMAQRGYVLTGAESERRMLRTLEQQFRADLAFIANRPAVSLLVNQDAAQLAVAVDAWLDGVVQPNLAERDRAGYAAFRDGTPGAERLRRGVLLMNRARDIHQTLLRDIRKEVVETERESESTAAYEELESFLIRAAALLIFLLVGTLVLRVVGRALDQVIAAAEALDAGRYEAARLPDAARAPNREMARLARTFDRVAKTIAQRERQLQDDIVQLKELERLKADFVSTVSHELRTPLTSMRGALGLVLSGKVGELPGKGRDLLQIALSNTERLIRLINDILDIEKVEAGHMTIRRERTRVGHVLEATVRSLESLARDAKVQVLLELADDAEVMGDHDRLVQVTTNLLSNAVKYSPAGATVDVRAAREGDALRVSVRDHGPGIPDEFVPRIFGRFQQAGGAESRRPGGTGLGLNIAKTIVELHGGRIGFEPAAGGGTRFWFTLPIATPAETPAAGQDARRPVLVVEDDPAMRDVLVAQLETFARPLAVTTGEEALEILQREPVGAIVLDPGLPGMSGFDLAKQVRADPELRRLPILIFTAREYTAEELRERGIRAADAFVKTHDSEEALIDRLRSELLRTR